MREADRLWTRVICAQPGRYIGWPTMARTSTGKLLAVFSGDRDGHICPWGKTHLVRSGDDGETWSAPEVIRHSPLDDRDAGIIETRRGDVAGQLVHLGCVREGCRLAAACGHPHSRDPKPVAGKLGAAFRGWRPDLG